MKKFPPSTKRRKRRRIRIITIADDTPIWFGKYKGDKMEDVPADYFLNFLDGDCTPALQKYIDDNRDVLQLELDGK